MDRKREKEIASKCALKKTETKTNVKPRMKEKMKNKNEKQLNLLKKKKHKQI